MGKTSELHKLLNRERTKRGLAHARWNQELWHGCKAHSNNMLRARRLFHVDTNILPDGGECVVGGRGNQSPGALCRSWMNSPRHAALILNPNIRSHAWQFQMGNMGHTPLGVAHVRQSILHLNKLKYQILSKYLCGGK